MVKNSTINKALRKFNLALLGKQAWRIIQYPNSLIARIFKARYFPNSTFLEAKIGNCPSFVWRSIWETQPIIYKGVRWRVGNGKSINIWTQPWVPNTADGKLQTEIIPQLEDTTVASLLKVDDMKWEEEILYDLFEQGDVERILNIPLSNRDTPDYLYWGWDEKGDYSVRSCYRAQQAAHIQTEEAKWTSMWKLKILPKVKNMLWRACTDCLPTAEALWKKFVPCRLECIHNDADMESTLHIFAECGVARACFRVAKLNIQLEGFTLNIQLEGFTDFKEWFGHNLSSLCTEKQIMLAMLCWALWEARNQKIWNNINLTPRAIVEGARSLWTSWSEAQVQPPKSSQPSFDRQCKWKKPQSGWIKANVDASLKTSMNRMGFGCVLRDENGSFIAAKCTPWKGNFQVKEAEAIGVREALSWIKQLGYSYVEVEMDAANVLQEINHPFMFSPSSILIHDIKEIARSIPQANFSFVKRSANTVAHELARAACSMSECNVWFFNPLLSFSIV